MAGEMERSLVLEVHRLTEIVPVLDETYAAHMAMSCSVCLDDHGYTSGVRLHADHLGFEYEATVQGLGTVTNEIRASYADLEKRVDSGACALALLLMPQLEELTAVQVSPKKNGIDYFLCRVGEEHLIFNHAAKLEVSGIHSETKDNTIGRRLGVKRRRIQGIQSEGTEDADLPSWICIVEFSRPQALVEKS